MALFGRSKAPDVASPESSPGGPVYDARIDPTISQAEVSASARLQQARDIHLFYGKTAAAATYSRLYEPTPGPLVGHIAQLAASRDQLERITSRRDWAPYPGVDLGHTPGVHASPNTNPVLGVQPHLLTHHAHQVESKRATRRRFGHG